MHAASRHGTPSLTSLPKDDEVSCKVRPLLSEIPLSLTALLHRACLVCQLLAFAISPCLFLMLCVVFNFDGGYVELGLLFH